MIYQILKPIQAYNGDLQTVCYVSEEGLKNLFSKEYIKRTTYKMNQVELTGDAMTDLKNLGYVVIVEDSGVVPV